MALITISGFPSSGKSRRALQIKAHLESRIQDPNYLGPKLKVSILSDDELKIDRSVYGGTPHVVCAHRFLGTNYSLDGRLEKPARAALFTAMQRRMGQDTILIADAMNYIKGFRYQMYCAAREMKVRVCTVSRSSTARPQSLRGGK